MGVILRAHPLRGESHIQRNASGEVASTDEFAKFELSIEIENMFLHFNLNQKAIKHLHYTWISSIIT